MDIHVHICYILVTLWIFNTQERNRYERKTIKKRKDFEGFLIIVFLDVVAEISKRENSSGHFVKYKKRTKETM